MFPQLLRRRLQGDQNASGTCYYHHPCGPLPAPEAGSGTLRSP
jgi:hypothetical protein